MKKKKKKRHNVDNEPKKTFEFDKFVKNDKCTRRNTGFPSKVTSEKVFSALEKKAKNLRYWAGKKVVSVS